MNDKVILVDCDGVILDWVGHFVPWLEKQGYTVADDYADHYAIGKWIGTSNNEAHKRVREFNKSAAIGFCPALRDAVHYVNLLYEKHGYVFDAITSLTDDPYAAQLRVQNLNALFGTGVFRNVICLGCGADKRETLEEYAKDEYPYFWIEDKPSNAQLGHDLGFRTMLMRHQYNNNHGLTLRIPEVHTWEEIYNLIIEA